MSEATPQSILEGAWQRQLKAEGQRRAELERRAAHFDPLVEALEILLTGENSLVIVYRGQARAALAAAKEATR